MCRECGNARCMCDAKRALLQAAREIDAANYVVEVARTSKDPAIVEAIAKLDAIIAVRTGR